MAARADRFFSAGDEFFDRQTAARAEFAFGFLGGSRVLFALMDMNVGDEEVFGKPFFAFHLEEAIKEGVGGREFEIRLGRSAEFTIRPSVFQSL